MAPRVIAPDRALTSPMMALSVVVFPAPFRPSKPTTSPAATSSDTSRRTWTAP